MSLYIRNESGGFTPIPSIKGSDGVTPHIGSNGNWFIGDVDTGKPSRGEFAHAVLVDGEYNVLSINHRGYCTEAPENTIPAYILSKEKGYNYVECDVSFTSDNVAVLLHDATIDRTSNGSGNISQMTYEEVLQYDFGSWKNSKYTGTRIPTFEEFIILCKRIGLHPYIELKDNSQYTKSQVTSLVEKVADCGMTGNVTWISFASSYLEHVKAADSFARLGYLISHVSDDAVAIAQGLQTGANDVFIDADATHLDVDAIAKCKNAHLPLEVWTVNSEEVIKTFDPYITGVTSDNLIAGKVLYDAGMTYRYGIAEDTSMTLIHDWDFANSLVDTVGGVTASTNATRNTAGVSFSSNNQYVRLLDNTTIFNKTIDIDIASGNIAAPTTQHARVFGVATESNHTNTKAAAFLWRYNTNIGWSSYSGETSGWDETIDASLYPVNFFDNKTLRMEFDGEGRLTIYYSDLGVNNFAKIHSWENAWGHNTGAFVLGSDQDNEIAPITFSGVRIYEKN